MDCLPFKTRTCFLSVRNLLPTDLCIVEEDEAEEEKPGPVDDRNIAG